MKKALSLIMVFMVAVMWSATGFSGQKYVSGGIGISWMNDMEATRVYDTEGERDGYELGFDSGLTLTGAFGCDYGDYRVEGELGYQSGDVITLDCVDDMSGDVTILSLMVNGYYDIALADGVELYPYAGVGVAQVSFDDLTDDSKESNDGHLSYTASEVTFAYQIGAGIGIEVSDGIMVDARYRYFATTDFTMPDDLDAFQGLALPAKEYNMNMESHSALLGMRVMF